jgi:hypothetical protein
LRALVVSDMLDRILSKSKDEAGILSILVSRRIHRADATRQPGTDRE